MAESEQRYSLNEVRDRFYREDIEIVCSRHLPVDIAIVHPDADEQSKEEINISRTYTTLHFPEHEAVQMTAVEQDGTMDIDEIAAMFGIDPNERVWEIGNPKVGGDVTIEIVE